MAIVERHSQWLEDMTEAIGKFQPVLLDCVEAELENLAGREGTRAKTARVALELAKDFERAGCGEAQVDDEIVSVALHRRGIVATADSSLARTLEGLHVQIVGLKSGRVSLSNG